MPKKKEDPGLTEWRRSHFSELEATLNVFKSIRDDPEAKDKDRIEAAKGVGRLLSAMSPEKIAVTASEEKNSASVSRRNIPTLSPALKAKLASVLNNAPQ
jgi:CO dehydrogenase/acetyl-CoA synthase delta subunit